MRNIIIGFGILATATLGYFAFSTSKASPPEAAETSDSESAGGDSINASERSKDGFVAPRRMRANSALGSDELSGESRRRMKDMGRGQGDANYRANLRKGLDGTPEPSDEALTERQEARSEVLTRRTKQWISDADKDDDGQLSPTEAELGSPHLRLILRDFDSADSNGDGAIDETELKSAAIARRAKRHDGR